MNIKVSLGALLLLSLITGCNNSNNPTPLPPPVIVPPPVPAPIICDITLSWTNPTHRVADMFGYEKPLAAGELAKLTFYANAPTEELTFVMDVSEVYALMWTIANVEEGIWYFVATVTDTLGQESDVSSEISKVCE